MGAAGSAGFGYTRIYANPDELDHPKRKILGEELNPVEADALRDAARRVLDHGGWIGRPAGLDPARDQSDGCESMVADVVAQDHDEHRDHCRVFDPLR